METFHNAVMWSHFRLSTITTANRKSWYSEHVSNAIHQLQPKMAFHLYLMSWLGLGARSSVRIGLADNIIVKC